MRRELAKARFTFFVDLWAFDFERFGRVFGGDLRAPVDPLHAIAGGPVNGIAKDQPDVLVIIDRIGLVAGTKVKDFSIATFPGATRAENFAALEPGNENNLIGRRHGERFAVHFDILDFEIAIDSARDRMGWVANPEPFLFAGFAPDDGTTRTHQPHEWFRVMRRVQRDETHSLPHSRQDALDDGVTYFSVRGVTPPDQDVSTLENAGG